MTTAEYLTQAELALAAYANLSNGEPDQAELRKAGMATIQADAFASRYSVVASIHDAESSFDATVFKDASGNLTLAIRGTLENGDYGPTDGLIFGRGVAYNQAIAMWNWWQRVSNPSSDLVAQYRLTDVQPFLSPFISLGSGLYLVQMADVLVTGELLPAIAADPDRTFDITGHSLGGHLAMAFGALFPSVCGPITVFNAPGFRDNSETQLFFKTLGGINSKVPSGALANVTNIIADETAVGLLQWSAIAGLHSRPGTPVNIAIENQWLSDEPNPPPAYNHSQQILTDSLAVYALLDKLDSTLSTDAFKLLLRASAASSSASLERIVDTLEKLFGLNSTYLPTGNNNRDDLYQTIDSLQSSGAFTSLAGRVSIELAPAALATRAKTDFSALVSLLTLSPIVLAGDSMLLEGELGGAWGTELEQWQNDKRLTPEELESGQAHYTDQWLKDRSGYLVWLVRANVADKVALDGTNYNYGEADNWELTDLTNRQTISIQGQILGFPSDRPAIKILFGADTDDATGLVGGSEDDRIYGGAGNDTLDGGRGDDYLEGNADDDSLKGGDGRDTLLGGADDDTLEGGIGDDTLTGGARQASCRLGHAALGCLSRVAKCVFMTVSRSGLSVTAPTGVQLRVLPDQRVGFVSRAAR